VHRIPYPPNKGDKVRSFNLLRHLAKDYRVLLGAFVDDPHDWRYQETLGQYCDEMRLVGISPNRRKLKSLTALFTGGPMSVKFYDHRHMRAWVRGILFRYAPSRIVIYSSAMAQYVVGEKNNNARTVVDFVDVDSAKWREYSGNRRWPFSWLYAREGRTLLEYDRSVAHASDASIFVTEREGDIFRQLVPEAAGRVRAIGNGVDTEFFSPDRSYASPYQPGRRILVFTGAMDYWANVDAVTWFAREVFPKVRENVRNADFYIVGARPTDAVRRLSKLAGVYVTGAVKEIRPYLAHANVAVAPLRIARGIQNKVLEAMAMARPVLATTAAMDGIRVESGFYDLVSDDADLLARRAVNLLLNGDVAGLGRRGRRLVLSEYSWASSLSHYKSLLRHSGGWRTAESEEASDHVFKERAAMGGKVE
jgi:sugar transferase (PEP-CTERM/EpsH1 system associated)